MAAKGTVLDARALQALVDDYGNAVGSNLAPIMTRAMNILEAQCVEITPVAETGNLEASTVIEIKKRSKGIIGILSFVTPYAARVHELPSLARGPRTKAKKGNIWGLAGPKYLERPLRGMIKGLPKITAKELQEFMKKLKVKKS